MARYIDIDKYSKWADSDRPCGIYDVNCNDTTCFECFYNKYKDIEEVAPVIHAEWFKSNHDYICTNCFIYSKGYHNYCPNCGAKMNKI